MKKDEALAELERIATELKPLEGTEAGVIVDLFLSYRALSAWDEMIALYEDMPLVLQRSVLVREQLAFALNRRAPRDPQQLAYRDRAVGLLEEVQRQSGPMSETGGLLGRIYKDRWQEALAAGRALEARGHLKRAIEAYVTGFKADWRDAYPGINAVTLLDVEGSEESLARKNEMLPVVHFAVERRIESGKADYWDLATRLELHVLANLEGASIDALADSLGLVRANWEPETTAKNLTYIYTARRERGVECDWLRKVIDELRARAGLDPLP